LEGAKDRVKAAQTHEGTELSTQVSRAVKEKGDGLTRGKEKGERTAGG